MNGNSTFIIGIEDDQVDAALEVIKRNSQKRQMNMPTLEHGGSARIANGTNVINVGGATVFILGVEKYIQVQYEKCKLDQANHSHKETQSILEAYLDIFTISRHRKTCSCLSFGRKQRVREKDDVQTNSAETR